MESANLQARTTPLRTIVYRLKSLQFHTTRKLLFAWIRPTILGCDRQSLNLEPGDSVCYSLPSRSMADLLVADKACETNDLPRPYLELEAAGERRSFFFLGHPEGTLGRKTLRWQSPRMIRLLEAQRNLERPIKIVPISLFWGHQPDQEKSIWKLLLSENWSATSGFKKLLALIFHRRHILVQFSQPISLKELIDSEPNPERQVRKLLRLLRVQFNRQKRAIIGPDLSHRRTLINSIMTSPAVREAIEKEAGRTNESPRKLEARALKYANEIASHQTYRVIRFFDLLLTWLWHKLYDGIIVNNIDQVKEHAKGCEVVYAPCHRSHVDYLLLSYVLYHNGLTPPHVAAGENLNMPLVGPFLRRGGAFFMRRSFRGDTLYRTVFDEYLHLMFVRGYSIEYFIEGGRSRSGRTLTPRTGMLSMTVSSFQRNPTRPICMMPVYFGYERIIEASTYMGELAGREKKAESVLDIFRVLRTLKQTFGRVTVNFGDPVHLDSFLDEELSDWRNPADISPRAFSRTCVTLSRQLVTRINSAAAITPVNLVATAILATPRQVMEEQRLHRQVDILLAIALRGPYSNALYVTDMTVPEIVREAERVAGIHREAHPFGDILGASPDVAILLTWYRNNTAHVYAIASFIARLVKSASDIPIDDVISHCSALYPCFQSEYFLPWPIDEIPDICRQYTGLLETLGLIECRDDRLTTAMPASEEYESLSELAEIIEPTIERFFIVISLLSEGLTDSIETLESHSSGIAHEMSTLYGIRSPDFFEKSLFTTLINTLDETGIITADRKITIQSGFQHLEKAVAAGLDADVQYNVLQAIARRRNVSG